MDRLVVGGVRVRAVRSATAAADGGEGASACDGHGNAAGGVRRWFNPPPLLELCSDYSHQRGQGATALLAIAALFLSNRAVASALAISALKGVSDLSSAAVPLSLCAAYAASEVEGDVALYALFAVYTLGHALACHDNTEPSRTHATVLSTIFLLTHVTFRVWVAACGLPLRAWRAARRSRPVRAPRDPRRNVLQGVTAARRA